MWVEGHSERNEQSPVAKKAPDFSKLIADSHLTKGEIKIISESYESDKDALITATQGELRNFIIKDYGSANSELLGWSEGVIALQKALNIHGDGSFGPDSFKAVIEYQKSHGLKIDGLVGPATQNSLGITKAVTWITWTKKSKNNNTTQFKNGTIKQDPARQDGPGPNAYYKTVSTPEASPRVETVSAASAIRRYTNLTNGIESQIKETNKHKQENTGVIAGVGDAIGSATGWFTTGKEIYQAQIDQAKNRARELHAQILAEFNGKLVSPQEQAEMIALVNRLSAVSWAKLEDVSWGRAYWNELKNTPDNAASAFHGWVGIVKWAWEAVKWVFDVTVFLVKLVDKDNRAKAEQQWEEIKVAAEKAGGGLNLVWSAFKKEIEKVSNLPSAQQSEAIGKIAGNVIAMIAMGWAIGSLWKARWAASVAQNTFREAAWAARLAGKTEQAAALGAAASKEAAKKVVYTIGSFALGGPAESAIGASLSKSFWFISNTLRWGASVAQKLKTVEKGIGDFAEAVKKETDPEKLKYLQDAKKALDTEREWLLKQAEAKAAEKKPHNEGKSWTETAAERKSSNTETGKPEVKEWGIPSNPPKTFETAGVKDRLLLQRLMSYYHTDKNSHELANAITQELNRIKGELKAWKDVRTDLEAIAKDAEGYLKKKNPTAEPREWSAEKPNKSPMDRFMENLSTYEKGFSEEHLRSLAKTDPEMFGMSLVHMHVIRQIKELARTHPAEALLKWEAFLKNPNKYLEAAYVAPYNPLGAEVRNFAKQAYEGSYRAEWEELMRKRAEMFDNYRNNNPEWKWAEILNSFTNDLKSISEKLGSSFADLQKEISSIIELLKANARENWKDITQSIDSFMEKVRLTPDMTLQMKADISKRMQSIKEKYFSKAEPANRETPKKWNAADSQGTPQGEGPRAKETTRNVNEAGINLPRSDGSYTWLRPGEYHVTPLDEKSYRVTWSENWKSLYKDIPREKFEAANPHIFESANESSFGWKTSEKWASSSHESRRPENANSESMPRRNTEYREWNEVPRAKEIISVGDLHGSRRAFELNLQKAGAVNFEWKWIGGNREIVFHGDILADRNADSLAIFERIRALREQAQREGGNITVLAGNHEDFAFAFLSWKDLPSNGRWVPAEAYTAGSQAHGISEFKKFWNSPQEILLNMRKNPEGRKILEDMCSMKLAEHIDDTLFVHVVPNESMLSAIAKNWVDNINKTYQQGMRFHLLGEWAEPMNFNSLRQAFLDTEHRTLTAGQPTYQSLREKGINHIIHGHDIDNAGASIDQYGMKITGNDFWFEKKAWANGENPSFIKVEKSGNFEYGNGKSMGREEHRKAA
jgi:peptidoglycan hydrolase-like protein with peptidoglycan-binding domain